MNIARGRFASAVTKLGPNNHTLFDTTCQPLMPEAEGFTCSEDGLSYTVSPTPQECGSDVVSDPWEWWAEHGSPRYALGPMAGCTAMPFRQLVRENGVGLTYVAMVSAGAVCYDEDTKNRMLADIDDTRDSPVLVQLVGNDPSEFAGAAATIPRDKVAGIDVNMGCSAAKAHKRAYGSKLMTEWPQVIKIMQALRECAIPITVKTRVFRSVERSVALCQLLVREGAVCLCVHGRFRDAGRTYSAPVEVDILRAIVQSVNVPVIVNGGVTSLQEADALIEKTGAAGVAVAHRMLANPALLNPTPPPPPALCQSYLAHALAYTTDVSGQRLYLNETKANVYRILRNTLKTRGLVEAVRKCESVPEIDSLLREEGVY
ncbi:tRNA-dihydrouridine synthase [Kipferlia bialata]|uniref:tRNA-dihydrouridine synthase n=1 Tax=Kipferlia bialata TaxID=797122 RepID=A0A9K3GMK5_9EUKA|nr:tRNA-dihydrouridine synthase [Kipferlia bialata]|eukprot:g9851.t1